MVAGTIARSTSSKLEVIGFSTRLEEWLSPSDAHFFSQNPPRTPTPIPPPPPLISSLQKFLPDGEFALGSGNVQSYKTDPFHNSRFPAA